MMFYLAAGLAARKCWHHEDIAVIAAVTKPVTLREASGVLRRPWSATFRAAAHDT